MDELDIRLMPFFALEGAAFAGKTTLLRYLKRNYGDKVVVIPEAGEYIGGDKNFPDAPFRDLDHAKASLHFFMEIERQRCLDAIAAHRRTGLPVILDRTTPISSPLLYLLMAQSELEKKDLFSDILQYASDYFKNQAALGKIFIPSRIVYVHPANQEIFEKRFVRGTKNTIFANWDSFKFLDRKYRQLMGACYPADQQLILKSENSQDNLENIAAETLAFIDSVGQSAELADVTAPDFLGQRELPNEGFDFDQDEKKYSPSRQQARKLMAVAKVNNS